MKFNINTLKLWLGKKINTDVIINKLNFVGFETTIEKNTLNTIIPYNRTNCHNLFAIINELSGLTNLLYFKKKCKKLYSKIKVENNYIKIKNTNFCPFYLSIVIKNFNNNIESDKKIKKILNYNNVNLHNYIVDLTNYMLLITGQPFHAYDLDKIDSNIVIKEIETDESFYTINNNKIDIKKNTLVITDQTNKILALPGIIGSAYAKVNKDTQNILIECAVFEKNKIKEIATKYNIKTNSSNIFAYGVNLNITEVAFNYCLNILNKNHNIKINTYSNNNRILLKQNILKITTKEITQIIGQEINVILLKKYFKKRLLNFKKYHNYWKIKIPYNRSDIQIPASIISELLKCHGYDEINLKPIKNNLITYNFQNHKHDDIKKYLIHSNFNEVINYSFVEENIEYILFDQKNVLKIENPMSDKANIMRSSLLQGLLRNIASNTSRHTNDSLNFFELGHVWSNKIETNLNLGIISTGNFLLPNLYNTDKTFYTIKNIIENICNKILYKKDLKFNTNENFRQCLNPKISTEIFLDGVNIGIIGIINNSILNLFNISKDTYFAEIFLDKINNKKANIKFVPFSKLPKITRDISFILNKNISYNELFNYINTLNINNLKTFYLTNIYTNTEHIEKKTLTFRFIFQNITTTLKDNDVNNEIQKIYTKIVYNFDALIKGFNDNNNN